MVRRYAVSVDGAALLGGKHDLVHNVLCRSGSSPNTTFHCNDILDVIGRPLRSDEEDWLDLLWAIYVTDLECHRGPNEEHNRDIELALPVRDPAHVEQWLPLVQELFGLMTHDSLQIHVESHTAPPQQRHPYRRRPPAQIDAVTLLSGGLDSAYAATKVVGQYPTSCFIACRTSPHVNAAQDAVLAALSPPGGQPLKATGFHIDINLRFKPGSPTKLGE